MTNKLTNRKALAIAIIALRDWQMEVGVDEYALDEQKYSPDDVIAKLESMAAALDNKATSTTRKPTAKQTENAALRDTILDFLTDTPHQIYTCTELGKKIPELDGMNNQRISALMKGLVDTGKVEKLVEKGKSFFRLARPTVEEEGA